ncbi:Phosphatidyl-N-methylethanolamine N-methyltransferase [Puccinia graminis f. sp. tritici]|uniref:Phosphatidyl-N-methylethanolamine N-methyltransferase n=1 Tax=Puccinia graminis f. sp. tritici TaxID=56615 RepID=A0A5B0MT26_PUCGR|nr:Phosphatidyl-N-methylethanolamine N-methyltransferase [Puccinia graminis f. sp. tritici]KAA1103887.1 Phosphatidyl-N-methylethanolamine N-methyltransferase [Puccinia graminis f. sp. tritici]
MSPIELGWYEGGLIDLRRHSFWLSLAWILFNPIFWNFIARQEHSTRFLTRLLGSPHRGCYFLGGVIFIIGLLRDHYFKQALEHQPTHPLLSQPIIQLISKAVFTSGAILVASSMWALGFTGTYLGDYFGILMDEIVEGFPFNLTSSPMYDGSTLCFLGTALSYQSPAGLVLTGIVYLVYQLALRFEDPFTANIYRQRDLKSNKSK